MLVTHLDQKVDYSHPIASVKEEHTSNWQGNQQYYLAMSGGWFVI